MVKSKFEYVKKFERDDSCLPDCWIVIRIDGRNFSKFCNAHQFVNVAALELMNRAAITVMEDFKEIILARATNIPSFSGKTHSFTTAEANPEVIGLKSLAIYQSPISTNNIKNTISASLSLTMVKPANNVLPTSQVANVNAVSEEAHSNKQRH
ncbi:uncharacterized protein LOC105834016 [Monomorium pharaonis]|uniref:uncharacterized protein LOC105834016 n=1 Tax=Monomorium pharaonis TaxID=307658 RepID=UPI00174772C0|nr:uncharacterized protein LOC105834016 [Monomorium pharaonis]